MRQVAAWLVAVSTLLLVVCAPWTLAYSAGAPYAACREMTPRHKTGATITHHTYQLVVEEGVRQGYVTVRLETLNKSVPFRGFFIRAMAIRGTSSIYFHGIFDKDSNFQDSEFVGCDSLENRSAVTHTSNSAKTAAVVHWKPEPYPKDLTQVFFRATVVRDFYTFYRHVDSTIILFGAASTVGFKPFTLQSLVASCLAPASTLLFFYYARP